MIAAVAILASVLIVAGLLTYVIGLGFDKGAGDKKRRKTSIAATVLVGVGFALYAVGLSIGK